MECDLCDKKFVSAFNLKRHKLTMHKDIEPSNEPSIDEESTISAVSGKDESADEESQADVTDDSEDDDDEGVKHWAALFHMVANEAGYSLQDVLSDEDKLLKVIRLMRQEYNDQKEFVDGVGDSEIYVKINNISNKMERAGCPEVVCDRLAWESQISMLRQMMEENSEEFQVSAKPQFDMYPINRR